MLSARVRCRCKRRFDRRYVNNFVCALRTIVVISQSACALSGGEAGMKPGLQSGVQPVSVQSFSLLAPS
jgi:hypothetical protein